MKNYFSLLTPNSYLLTPNYFSVYLMSTPHIILLRNESKNEILCGTAKRIYLFAFLMVKMVLFAILKVRLSIDIDASLLRVLIWSVTTLVSGITIGRIVRLCGASGVSRNEWHEGATIGPPALNEYAVEPVGVEIITPSPLYVAT